MLIGVISALVSALLYVVRTRDNEMKAERDYLRAEVIAALTAIVHRMNEVARERDVLAHNLEVRLDNLQRLVVQVKNIVGKLGGVVHREGMD